MIFVKRCSFTLVFFKAACNVYPGAEINFAGAISHISRHVFLKFSNTSPNNNGSLWTYKSWYFPKFFTSKSLQTLFAWA